MTEEPKNEPLKGKRHVTEMPNYGSFKKFFKEENLISAYLWMKEKIEKETDKMDKLFNEADPTDVQSVYSTGATMGLSMALTFLEDGLADVAESSLVTGTEKPIHSGVSVSPECQEDVEGEKK